MTTHSTVKQFQNELVDVIDRYKDKMNAYEVMGCLYHLLNLISFNISHNLQRDLKKEPAQKTKGDTK